MSKINIDANLHSLLNPGSVVLVSSGDGEGEGVFAVTWNMPVKKDPPMVAIECSQNHYTYQFIKKTGEFGINVPHAKMVDQVLGCGSVSGKTGVDKFKKFGLSRQKAERIKGPLVADAFANLECRVVQVVDLGASALVIGAILCGQVESQYFVDGKLNFDSDLELLHHLGGNRFAVTDRQIIGKKI